MPYGQAEEALLKALYPADHPYHHSVIGSMADLSAARLADVSAFFRTYYVPNNAILCVAGDFQPEQAKTWIKKYFGPLPRGPEVIRPKPSIPKLTESKHITMTDAVSLPRAELIWPTVPSTHPDEPALDVLAAVLGGLPKENRLFRTLMYDRQLAAQVRASHPTHLLSGTFEVELYAQPGQKLDELVKIAEAEIERLKKEGPTAAEVRKAQNERESELVMGMQSVTRKAALLNEYMDRFGDPLGYQAELDKIFAVTPEDVKRVARDYLGPHFIELDVVPGDAGLTGPGTGRGPGDASAACRARRSWRSTTSSTVADPRARADAPVHRLRLRAPQALERPGAQDRRATRPADRDARPGRQVGRDVDAQGQGRAGLDRHRLARRGNEARATLWRSPASWPRSARRWGQPASWNRRPSA